MGWRIAAYRVKSSRWKDTPEDRKKAIAHTMIVCDKLSSQSSISSIETSKDNIHIAKNQKNVFNVHYSGTNSIMTSDTKTTVESNSEDPVIVGENKSVDIYVDKCRPRSNPIFQPLIPGVPIKGTLDDTTYNELVKQATFANFKIIIKKSKLKTENLMNYLLNAVNIYENTIKN